MNAEQFTMQMIDTVLSLNASGLGKPPKEFAHGFLKRLKLSPDTEVAPIDDELKGQKSFLAGALGTVAPYLGDGPT